MQFHGSFGKCKYFKLFFFVTHVFFVKLHTRVWNEFRIAILAENIPQLLYYTTIDYFLFPFRFKDVLPYDENRVKLAAGDKDNRNGYINASHVSATIGNQQRFYIAGQGPLPHTVPHFCQASTYYY